MEKWLEKKRLWFWIYVGIKVFVFAYGILAMIVGTVAIVSDHAGVFDGLLAFLKLISPVLSLYAFLYYIYRLFYLYRGRSDRVKWTVIVIVSIVGGWLDFIPVAGDVIGLAASILGIACIVHDYGIVTAPEKAPEVAEIH